MLPHTGSTESHDRAKKLPGCKLWEPANHPGPRES